MTPSSLNSYMEYACAAGTRTDRVTRCRHFDDLSKIDHLRRAPGHTCILGHGLNVMGKLDHFDPLPVRVSMRFKRGSEDPILDQDVLQSLVLLPVEPAGYRQNLHELRVDDGCHRPIVAVKSRWSMVENQEQ